MYDTLFFFFYLIIGMLLQYYLQKLYYRYKQYKLNKKKYLASIGLETIKE